MIAPHETAPLIFSLCAVLFISGLFWFRSYAGLKFRPGFAALLGSVAICGYNAWLHLSENHTAELRELLGRRVNELEVCLPAFAAGAIMVFGAALLLRLWGRWIGEKATAEELRPGLPGVRAWFNSANVTVGIIIVVCAWFGYEISPFVSALAIGAVLAAAPLLRMEWPVAASAPVTEDMSAEREKILSMLESGKLTADESAELLQALGASSHAAPRQVVLSGGQRLMLAGAALVTLGFFLPWFVYQWNPPRGTDANAVMEASRMLNQIQKSMAQMGGGVTGMNFPNTSISVSGGDIGRGLGWITLALALGAALLPYLAGALRPATARTIRLLCMGMGGLIVLYLLTQNIRYAGIGLMIAVGGYAVEVAGMLRERRGLVG